MTTGNFEGSFLDAMRAVGLETRAPIEFDDRIHCFHVEGDAAGSKNGRYRLHPEGFGWFGTWKENSPGDWNPWSAKKLSDLTPAERDQRRQYVEQGQREAVAEQAERRKRAAGQAAALWDACKPVESHPYLAKKGVQVHGIRLYRGGLSLAGIRCDGALVVPLRNAEGEIRSLQIISAEGDKRFLAGGEKTGCFYKIGESDQQVCIAEGFATAASMVRGPIRSPRGLWFQSGMPLSWDCRPSLAGAISRQSFRNVSLDRLAWRKIFHRRPDWDSS